MSEEWKKSRGEYLTKGLENWEDIKETNLAQSKSNQIFLKIIKIQYSRQSFKGKQSYVTGGGTEDAIQCWKMQKQLKILLLNADYWNEHQEEKSVEGWIFVSRPRKKVQCSEYSRITFSMHNNGGK